MIMVVLVGGCQQLVRGGVFRVLREPRLVTGDYLIDILQCAQGADLLEPRFGPARIRVDRPLVAAGRLADHPAAVTFQQVAIGVQQPGIARILRERRLEERLGLGVKLFPALALVAQQKLFLVHPGPAFPAGSRPGLTVRLFPRRGDQIIGGAGSPAGAMSDCFPPLNQ